MEGHGEDECQGDEAVVVVVPVVVAVDHRGDGERDDGHELDEDVEGRAGGILEWISDGVADDACLVGVGTLLLVSSLTALDLDVLLAVVPGATGVGHHDGEHGTRCDGTGQKASQSIGAEEEANEDGGENSVATGKDHLLN
eukprot:829810_1